MKKSELVDVVKYYLDEFDASISLQATVSNHLEVYTGDSLSDFIADLETEHEDTKEFCEFVVDTETNIDREDEPNPEWEARMELESDLGV